MSYTLAAAAAACGVNKTTILRAIKSGKISATRDEHNEWHVEPAELHRVYPPVAERSAGNGAAPRYAAPDAAAIADAQRAGLIVEVGILREQLTEARTDRDHWRGEASAWRDQAQAVTRQLTDQRERRPWWRRLAG
jgi:hypothetical protein